MKLVKQSYEILEQEIPVRKMDDYSGSHFREQYMENMLKHIERCGKICYKSEHTIKEGSAEKFADRLIKSEHLSVLEHGAVYLKFPNEVIDWYDDDKGNSIPIYMYTKYGNNKYSICHKNIVTTNYRVIIENGWEDDLQYLCEPTEHHEKRHTVLLHTCIHVYKDLTRQRPMSPSVESTRYCNYTLGRFGSELKFIILPWVDYTDWDKWNDEAPTPANILYDDLLRTERNYGLLINAGWTAEQAAEILVQCTAADMAMSGFESDWNHVFDLRVLDKTGKAHPLVHEALDPVYLEFKEKGWVK